MSNSDKSTKKDKKSLRQQAINKRRQSIKKKTDDEPHLQVNHIAFTFYVIAIAAKLTRLAATVSANYENEIESFHEIFAIPRDDREQVEAHFKEAINDEVDAKHYARQILNHYGSNKVALEELVLQLLTFADADTRITTEKAEFLKEIILALKFNKKYFGQVLRKHLLHYHKDPYVLLGVPRNVKYVELKKAYRDAVRDCHPDKITSQQVSKELVDIANEQFNYYQTAFQAVKTKKGFH